MVAFCEACPCCRCVRKTALCSEPPSHCWSGNFPATTRPSHARWPSVLIMSRHPRTTFYAIRQIRHTQRFFAGVAQPRFSTLPALIAERHFRFFIQHQRPDEGERGPGAGYVNRDRQHSGHTLLQVHHIGRRILAHNSRTELRERNDTAPVDRTCLCLLSLELDR